METKFMTTMISLLVCFLMIATAPRLSSAITCGTVATSSASCFSYLRTGGRVPPACCTGVRSLYTAAKTTPDRQQVCSCIKTLLKSLPGVKPENFAGLPSACGVNLGYPISMTMDCSGVH